MKVEWLRRSGPAKKVVAIGSLVVMVLLVLTTILGIVRYNAELTDAARELRTIDLLLAEEAGRSLQSVELVLKSVADQVDADDVKTAEDFVSRESTKTMHDFLKARVAGVPQLDAVTLVDARGKLINFSRYWPIPPVDLSDRDYFAYLRENRTGASFLSTPVVNRGSGTPTVYLARRISAPDGSFVGMVLGAIELGYFERLYASFHLDPGNFIALWRQDGILLARYPPATLGQHVAPREITSARPTWHGVPGVFEKSWTIEGGRPEVRIVASQAIEGFPLQINIGRSKSLVLTDWRNEVASIGGAVAMAVLCIVGLVWALVRRFHAYEAVAAASRERERAILARQQAEEALRQSQKMEAIGQLTGGVAHDFNNLLTVIRSSIELLKRPSLSEQRRTRYVDFIIDATDRAAKLTGQLLAFARRQTLKPQVFDVVANVTAIGELVDRLTGSRIKVTIVLPDGPCYVEADPNQFDTSLVNMAVNSRDAMANGGELTISVRHAKEIPALRAHAAVAGEFVALSLRDTGLGIPPETLDRVFEPFFTTKKAGEGTGLGLSQVLGFAKQSGGDVLLESTPGHGTTCTLYLPCAAQGPMVAKPETPSRDAMRGIGRTAGQAATRILFVEDNERVAQTTFQALNDLGYETVWANSAEQALSELGSSGHRFDIVFSDVVMGGMSGLELGRIIRQRFAGLPVVLASGYSHVLAEEGADGFPLLQKPYALDALSSALREAMDSRLNAETSALTRTDHHSTA